MIRWPVGGVVGFDVEVGQTRFEEAVRPLDGVGSVERGLETHHAPVQLLGVRVVTDGLLKCGESTVEVAGHFAQLGEARDRVDSPPAQVLTGRFGPLVVGAFDEVPAVRLVCLFEGPITVPSSSPAPAALSADSNLHISQAISSASAW